MAARKKERRAVDKYSVLRYTVYKRGCRRTNGGSPSVARSNRSREAKAVTSFLMLVVLVHFNDKTPVFPIWESRGLSLTTNLTFTHGLTLGSPRGGAVRSEATD